MPIRSPNHPSVSLPVALERARQFHLAWGQDEAGFEESLRRWGYTPRSNLGRNLVKSMATFGLLETSGRGQQQRLRINGSAHASLFDEQSAGNEKSNAILQLALKPDIYQAVWQRWGFDLPEDETLGQYLVEDLGFNPRAVSRFMQCYVETINLARQHGLAPAPDDSEDDTDLDFDDDEIDFTQSRAQPVIARGEDDTDLEFESADQEAAPGARASDDEDIDFEPETVDLPLDEKPRKVPLVDDDDIDFDFSGIDDDCDDEYARVPRDIPTLERKTGPARQEFVRYRLSGNRVVFLSADGPVETETVEELVTHLIADMKLGVFEPEDD